MSLENMKTWNPNMSFYDVYGDEFTTYGRVLDIQAADIISFVEQQFVIPKDTSTYLTNIQALHSFYESQRIHKEVFGYMPMQCGLVHGENNQLTGIEYHQGSEVNIAVEDCILLLGNINDMKKNHFHADKTKAFYLHKGDVIEVFSTTLHYTPLQTSSRGFSTLVYLLEGTNTEIAYTPHDVLTKKNKWYICHPTQQRKIAMGNIAGLDGEMIVLNYEG